MSSQPIIDYLTKQIFIQKQLVTYRSLSREFSLHVNVAKNELAAYHSNAPYMSQTCMATYLLCGEVSGQRTRRDSYESQDIQMETSQDYDTDDEEIGEEVTQIKMTVVNEKDLEGTFLAKSRYLRLNSITVYSLGPSPVYDLDLLATLMSTIREVDDKKGQEFAIKVGKIIGKGIEIKAGVSAKKLVKNAPVVGPSRLKSTAGASKAPAKEVIKTEEDEPKEKNRITAAKPKEKPKPAGKMDFFKAKPKEIKKEEPTKPKAEEKKHFFNVKPVAPAANVVSEKIADKEPPKRGTKRKSTANTLLSDSEQENQSTLAAPSKVPSRSKENLRAARGVILSDDESDVPRRSRRKSRAESVVNSEAEREALALMDIDDDQVIRASSGTSARVDKQEEVDEDEAEEKPEVQIPEDEDTEMIDDAAPKAKSKPKKKKEKKVIPLGRNGLKKKRIVKSRSRLDAKGYTITEDYSSYESVGEEEEPEAKPTPAKGKGKAKVSTSVKKEAEDSGVPIPAPKAAPVIKPAAKKSAGAAKGGQKGITGFFAPKEKK
ncbi:DNA polymerase subunit Cdc27 [Crucibulum laeve]|uniref:DNA polymerase delta subunit 3 n=1 Tax=Crucibulum laeve TaxID=68775 RepID=A0A5C3M3T3_9AGAR|nr:DNA polymerase subunit Cdc27 [Crucibulum laeve]